MSSEKSPFLQWNVEILKRIRHANGKRFLPRSGPARFFFDQRAFDVLLRATTWSDRFHSRKFKMKRLIVDMSFLAMRMKA
jgi:hypothetical protein